MAASNPVGSGSNPDRYAKLNSGMWKHDDNTLNTCGVTCPLPDITMANYFQKFEKKFEKKVFTFNES